MAVTLRELLVRIDTNTTGLNQGLLQSEKRMKRFSGTASMLSRSLLGVFAVDRVLRYGRAIVETTAEFEKLEKVLSSTLGSSSMAQKSFQLIAKFAAKTPFTVQEVTQSFVKLANRGVVPTYKQLERMADVASVLGKPFQQLVEAILDVSNSKRWTELGIKASNAGDKVRLTFRGVTKEVERTEAGVLGAITAFGEMGGVFGVTASVATTTAGKLGELGDNLIFLRKHLGDSQSGAIHSFLDFANNALGKFNTAMGEANRQTKIMAMAKLTTPDAVRAKLDELGFKGIIKDGRGVEYALEGVNREVLAVRRQMLQSNIWGEESLIAETGDSIETLEKKLGTLQFRLESRQGFDYFELLKEVVEEDISTLNKALTDLTKKQNDQAAAAKVAAEERREQLAKEREQLLELSRIETDARKSEKIEDFVMPGLESGEQFRGLNDMLATLQEVANSSYSNLVSEELQKVNNLMDDQEEKRKLMLDDFKRIGEVSQFWGQTMTDIFAAMIDDGANAVQILTDAIKKMAARLAAAATAAGLVSLFLGGSNAAALKALGGFKGLFSSFAGIPAFADGGLVGGPTMGMIGEGPMTSKSNPEVIAPLSDLKNMLGMNNGQLVARVSGKDLLFIVERAQRDYDRL